MNTLNCILLALLASLSLCACGGGDFEKEDRATVQPVDCKATPKACL